MTHPDLRHPDGRTRVVALWDQGAAYDPARPNAFGYGRIHRSADIDRALQSTDPFAALGYDPRRSFPRGGSHRTHTLGISGGNGRAGGPSGLAPRALLAFVDLSTRRDLGSTGLGDSAALLESLEFLAGSRASRASPTARHRATRPRCAWSSMRAWAARPASTTAGRSRNAPWTPSCWRRRVGRSCRVRATTSATASMRPMCFARARAMRCAWRSALVRRRITRSISGIPAPIASAAPSCRPTARPQSMRSPAIAPRSRSPAAWLEGSTTASATPTTATTRSRCSWTPPHPRARGG